MSGRIDRGTVKIVNGRYRPSGHFHYIDANTPIYDETGKLWGVTNPRDITHIHTYGGEAPFFEALKDGKLLGTKCDNPNCEYVGTTYMPFRIHCPDCLARNAVVDLTEIAKSTARIHSFMVTARTGAFNTLPKPIKFINVEFDGVDTILMGSLTVGDPVIGNAVVPIFNTKAPTFTILDLSWVVKGTAASALPSGFSFG